MHLEMVRYLSGRVSIQAHQNPLDPQYHPRLFVPLCLATEFQQLGDGCLLALCKCWPHIAIMAHFINDVELFRRIYIALFQGRKREPDIRGDDHGVSHLPRC